MDQAELTLKTLQLNCTIHQNEEIAFLNLNPHLNHNANPNIHNTIIKTRLFCHKCNIDDPYIRPLHSIESMIKTFNLQQFETKESLLLDLQQTFQNGVGNIRNNLQKIEIDFFREIAELRLQYLEPDLLQTICGKPQLKVIDLQHLGDTLSKAIQLEQDQMKIKCQVIKVADLDQLKNYIKQLDNANLQLEMINNFKPIIYDDKYRSQQITQNKIKIENFALNVQGNTLIVAGSDHHIYIHQLQENNKWKEITQLKGHSDHISSIIVNKNSNMIITSSKDNNINIWRLNSKHEWTLFQEIKSHTSWVKDVQFNLKENEFASCGEDQIISIWRQKQNCQWEQYQILKQHQDYVYSISYNKDSNLMASGGGDKQVIIWIYEYSQWKLRQILQVHENEVYKVKFSKHSNQLCSASWDQIIVLWTINKDGSFVCSQKLIGHDEGLKTIQFNSNSNILASSSKDGVLKIWQKTQNNNYECTQTIQQNFKSIQIQFSNDSKKMYTCSQDSLIIYQS